MAATSVPDKYCVVCGRTWGSNYQRCCTDHSLVGVTVTGWLRKQRVYSRPDGHVLTSTEMSALGQRESEVHETRPSPSIPSAQLYEASKESGPIRFDLPPEDERKWQLGQAWLALDKRSRNDLGLAFASSFLWMFAAIPLLPGAWVLLLIGSFGIGCGWLASAVGMLRESRRIRQRFAEYRPDPRHDVRAILVLLIALVVLAYPFIWFLPVRLR